MHQARKFLFPFSVLYGGIMQLRNFLYRKSILKSTEFELPVICVGNLSTGGTGKTPMVEFLVRLLQSNYKIAILSRGYKRSTSGFLLLKGNENATETGDEPLQFKQKFRGILVAVAESRTTGIKNLLQQKQKPDVILLDDAFQHRKVRAGFNILLTSYRNLYSEDMVLPVGNLREPKAGAKRANIIVITKCPAGITEEEKEKIKKELKPKRNQEIFFSSIKYEEQVYAAATSEDLNLFGKREFTLVTGIANPTPLVDFLRGKGLHFQHMMFPDHHNFTPAEVKKIAQQNLILTTEKDFMRLKDQVPREKLFYLPIKTVFLGGEAGFEVSVLSYVKKNEIG